jgi:hypothetical protein
MEGASMANGFEEIVSSASPPVRRLAEEARESIRSIYPNVVEVPWPKQGIIGYGVGPKKMSEHFCYISVSKEHINIGFMYGAELPDPEGLLDGTGKLLRHVQIREPEQLLNPALRELIQIATKHRMPKTPSRPGH